MALNHYTESDPHEKMTEVDATGNIEEIKKETNMNSDHIEENDVVKITTRTEILETMDNTEKENKFCLW